MRFLLRLAFWLGVVLVLLPSGGSQPLPQGQVSSSEAFSAARAAVSDVRGFCERQPDACVVGSQAATTIGYRLQAGAKVLYEFLNEHFAQNETATGAVTAKAPPIPPARPSQNTLMAADLAPVWRGPQPHKEARELRAGVRVSDL
jgi:hypothetical protein